MIFLTSLSSSKTLRISLGLTNKLACVYRDLESHPGIAGAIRP